MIRLCPGIAAALLALTLPAAARAQEPVPAPRVLAVLGLAVNAAAAEQAAPVEALLASHLSEATWLKVVSRADLATLVDVERSRQLLSGAEACEEACAAELAGAVGADLVLTSRLDRLGTQFVLTASLIDVPRAVSLAKPRAEAGSEAALPFATRELAAQLLAVLAPPEHAAAAGPSAAGSGRHFVLGLKVGNTLLTNLAKFNLGGDLQLGYQFAPQWVAFLQVGVTAVRAGNVAIENVALVPSLLGIRHLYRVDHRLQPYWGLGLGVQINLNSRFKFVENQGVLPAVHGMGGFQYFLTPKFALGLEASMNIAGMVVELTSSEQLRVLNLNFHGALTWRF